MPLNEAQGFRLRGRNNLTKQQKRDAELALYGLSEAPSMSTQSLSSDEIEKMRTLVLQHDASNKNENKEFDLNNPPRTQYIHQPWPVTVYHHTKRANRIVANQAELAEALKAGWQKEPYPAEVVSTDPELDEETLIEIEKLKAKGRKAAAAAKK